jgi:hypothetical protein
MIDEIRELWRVHQAAAFPEGIAGNEVEGEDLISLDSFTAGCISAFLGCSGSLDPLRRECLVRCRDGSGRVLPQLDGDAKAYYSRLHRMAQLALRALGE